jgi:FAD/FMN-containing dehydrogenase
MPALSIPGVTRLPAVAVFLLHPWKMNRISPELLSEFRRLLGPVNVISEGETLETLSKDFYWYSPILRRQLDDKRADVILRPGTLEETKAVMARCCRERLPVVARGAGTGNYGQSIPLFGGAVFDLSRLDRILSLEDGVARVEAGARLGAIETAARTLGWELRCMPSTWMKSTMGGFICGGSGGIGSITWGGINAPGTMKSVTFLTCEESPRLIRFEEDETLKALHTYGTTGLMVELEMRLAPKIDYDQLIFGVADWDRLLDWTDAAARRPDWRKRLVTLFEWPIPSYFKPLQRSLRPNEHSAFLLLDRAQTEEVVRSAESAGIACLYRRPLADPPKPPFITDYTWNHTTLWAIKSDPSITYLQSGFGRNFRGQFAELHRRFPGEIMFHLEWTVGNSKMLRGNAAVLNPDPVVVGGIPLVRFRSEERLSEILRCCDEIGVFIANPHTCYLEEGGRHPNIAEKRALKSEVDPQGLLNPGKMKTYPYNPFAESAKQA